MSAEEHETDTGTSQQIRELKRQVRWIETGMGCFGAAFGISTVSATILFGIEDLQSRLIVSGTVVLGMIAALIGWERWMLEAAWRDHLGVVGPMGYILAAGGVAHWATTTGKAGIWELTAVATAGIVAGIGCYAKGRARLG